MRAPSIVALRRRLELEVANASLARSVAGECRVGPLYLNSSLSKNHRPGLMIAARKIHAIVVTPSD
jgi:hypothetical protein